MSNKILPYHTNDLISRPKFQLVTLKSSIEYGKGWRPVGLGMCFILQTGIVDTGNRIPNSVQYVKEMTC